MAWNVVIAGGGFGVPGVARKTRAVIDWTASLPFRRDISEVGSIGHPQPLRSSFQPDTG